MTSPGWGPSAVPGPAGRVESSSVAGAASGAIRFSGDAGMTILESSYRRSAISLEQLARRCVRGYGGVIAFDDGAALEGAQDLVAAGNDLLALLEAGEHFDVGLKQGEEIVTLLESGEHFDVGGSGDPGGDGNEDGAEFSAGGAESVDALVQHGPGGNGGVGCWSGCRGAGQLSIVPEEDLFHGGIALNQRLNGDGERVGFLRD